MTALFAATTAAWAQYPAAVASLPVGSPITIVSDETVDARVHPGSEFRAHLRDPLEIGSTLVAAAGTAARLVVIAKDTAKDGALSYRIAITGLNLGAAGLLPVRPVNPVLDRITAGLPIPVTTLAAVGFEEGKVRVAVPLPFKLSNDPPNTSYTPAPLRTAAPIINHRRGTPTPGPASSPPASPAASSSPDASPMPAPSGPSAPLPAST